MWQKLGRCYPPQLELIPLFLLVLTLYLALSNYAALPDSIPTHFNAQGIADDWGSKDTILIILGLNAFIYVLLTAINIGFAVVRDPRVLINLPARWKARLSDTQIEQLRVILNRCLLLLKILMQGLLGYIVYITIEIALGRAASLGAAFFLLMLGIAAVVGLMLWQALRLTRTPRRLNTGD